MVSFSRWCCQFCNSDTQLCFSKDKLKCGVSKSKWCWLLTPPPTEAVGRHLWPFLCVFISQGVLWPKRMKPNLKRVVQVERFLDGSTCLSCSWHSFCPFPSCFLSDLWHCSLAGLFWAAPVGAGGGKEGGGGERWLGDTAGVSGFLSSSCFSLALFCAALKSRLSESKIEEKISDLL